MKMWFYDDRTKGALFSLDENFIPNVGDEFTFNEGLPREIDLERTPTGVERFKKAYSEHFLDMKFTVTSVKRIITLTPCAGSEFRIQVYGTLTPITCN